MTTAIDSRCFPDPCGSSCHTLRARITTLESELARVRGVLMAYAVETVVAELRERVVAAERQATAAEYYARRWKRLARRLRRQAKGFT